MCGWFIKSPSLKKFFHGYVIFILIYCYCYDNDTAYVKGWDELFFFLYIWIPFLFYSSGLFAFECVCVALPLHNETLNPYNRQSTGKKTSVFTFFLLFLSLWVPSRVWRGKEIIKLGSSDCLLLFFPHLPFSKRKRNWAI